MDCLLQGLKRIDQSTVMDIFKVKKPATAGGVETPEKQMLTSSDGNDQELSRIRKLEKLIKKRL